MVRGHLFPESARAELSFQTMETPVERQRPVIPWLQRSPAGAHEPKMGGLANRSFWLPLRSGYDAGLRAQPV